MSADIILLDDLINNPIEGKDIVTELARHSKKKYKLRSADAIKRIVIHTTDMEIEPWHLARLDIKPNHISKTGVPGITYHEMIMPNGFVYKTLYYKEVAWHVGIWNYGSIGIAMSFKVSDKDGRDTYGPSKEALRATRIRCGDLCLAFGIRPSKVFGHRELRGTGWFWRKGSKRLRKTCPGMKVDLDLLRKNVAIYMQKRLQDRGLLAKVDGIFGPKSIKALMFQSRANSYVP